MIFTLGVLIGLCCFAIVIAGLLALLRNQNDKINRKFFYLTIFVGIWTTANFIGSNTSTYPLTELAVKIDFSGAIFMAWMLLIFVAEFLAEKDSRHSKITEFLAAKKFFIASLLINLALIIFVAINKIITVSIYPELIVHNEVLYPVYLITLLTYVLLALGDLGINYIFGTKSDRKRMGFIGLGFALAAVSNILSNLIFPYLFSDRSTIIALNTVGYLGIIALVFCLYLAITTRKLFDIRLVVARSLAYLLSLGFIGVVTSFILFFASAQLSELGINENILRAFYVVVTIGFALAYLPVKSFFDKVTNRLFYRDAYDEKDLLDDFNQAIVSTIELEKLLDKSATVVEKYLKPDFCAFALIGKEGNVRLLHSKNSSITEKIVDQVRSYIASSPDKTFLTDLLDANQADMKALLNEIGAGMIVRITKAPNTEGIGYMILGNKKSGTIYNSQDTGVVEIVANELAIAVENALQYEEIQQFNITLQDKVDEATKNLRKANEKLKQLDQTKDDFISMASHQLRTPLTSVKGYVSMVLEGDAGKVSSKQKELLNQAFVSSQRMVYLIADLLNVSRLRTGKFVIEAKPTNLADVVEGEIKQLIETAKGRNLEMTYQKPKSFPTLMLDDTKIRQVIMNFADNAIYYTPSGGHIQVELEDKGETIEFRVVDDGLGVPKSEQHHLFNKFYRASNAKKARPDGTGLGLFMAKKVIVAQGGAIVFKTQEGKGSTFGFSFEKKKLSPEHFKGTVAQEPPKA